MADKKGRVQELIQRNVSEIVIYDLKNDICKLASIQEVKMTSDYSFCKIYVSHIDPSKADDLVSFLNSKAKLIRSKLSSKLDIYKTPELRFEKDTLFEKSQKMDALIDKAINSKPLTLKDLEAKEKATKKKKATAKTDASKKKKTTSKNKASKNK